MRIKRRKKRSQPPDRLISPCSGCGRETKDKRYGRCKGCSSPHDYAMAVEAIYCHLPNGIDPSEIHCSNDGRVQGLSEVGMLV